MFSRKKILAFVMLLVVAAPFLFFAGFFVKQKQLQHEMKEKLENASLQTITVNDAEIHWLKKNREVIIDGKLFDVKSYTVTANKIVLTGLFDSDEDELTKELVGMMNAKEDEPVPFNQLILKFIFTPVIDNDPATTISSFSQNIQSFYSVYSEVVVSQSLSVNTPPPNV